MKTTFFKSALFAVLAAGFAVSCVQDDDYSVPSANCVEPNIAATMDVSEVPAGTTLAQFTQDEIIEAYVTSSDEGGNFFKTISFQTLDGQHAFSVPVDITSTFINFEPGRKVYIKLKNLYTDVAHEGVRIGTIYMNGSTAAVGRLSLAQVRESLVRSCTVVSQEDLIQTVSISELQDDFYINKLVELNNVQFVNSSVGDNYYEESNSIGGATNHLIEDAFGNTVVFRTSSFANFASSVVPGESGTIRGVLTKFNGMYQFMARTAADIMLTDARMGMALPFFSEDFESATNNTDFNFAGWTNFAEAGTWLWREKTFQGNGYAEFSAFNSGSASNIVWLVTPGLDFSTFETKIVSFKVAQHHLDGDSPLNTLKVYVSTDYNGTDVLAATWTEVSYTPPTFATPWYEFVTSTIDLSSYSGTIHVAFKFIGSGTNTNADGAYQIDDFNAYGL